jgi:hypothetical protein
MGDMGTIARIAMRERLGVSGSNPRISMHCTDWIHISNLSMAVLVHTM